MGKFEHSRRKIYIQIGIATIIIILLIIFAVVKINISYLKYNSIVFSLILLILGCKTVLYDLKRSAFLEENKLNLSSNGTKIEVMYYEIKEIKYIGIPHSIIFDYLCCKTMDGQFYIDSTYENYEELWRSVVDNVKTNNPDVIFSKSLLKRIGKIGNGTNQEKK